MDRKIISEQTKTVDLGSLPFEYEVSNGRHFFNVLLSDIKSAINTLQIIPAICPGYRSVTNAATWIDKDVGYRIAKGDKWVTFVNNDYSTVSSFKQAMSGVPFTYVTNQQSKEYTVLETCRQVDLGTLNWEDWGAGHYAAANITFIKKPINNSTAYVNFRIIGDKYSGQIYNQYNIDMSISISSNNYLVISDSDYKSVKSFKQAVQGIPLTYELANPAPYAIKNVITI